MKMIEMKKIRKIIVALTSAMAILAIVLLTYSDGMAGSTEVDDTSDVPTIESSVTISGTTYTAENKLKIIEIVPQDYQRELGWLIGSEYYNVKFEDIIEYMLTSDSNYDNGFDLLKSWYARLKTSLGDCDIQFYVYNEQSKKYVWTESDFPYWGYTFDEKSEFRIVDGDGNIYRYKDEDGNVVNLTNILAYKVFGDYNMADKIDYVVMTPSQLTEADIDEAALIYINTAAGARDTAYFQLYQSASGYMPEKYPLTYTTVQSYAGLGLDFSAKLTWYLYRAIVNYDVAIVADLNSIETYFASDSNAVKLSYLINAVDRDKFKEHFWSTEIVEDISYSGTVGTFDVDTENDTLVIKYTLYNEYDGTITPETELVWSQKMFAEENYFQYSLEQIEEGASSYYYDAKYGTENRTVNVWNNVFTADAWNTLLTSTSIISVNVDLEGSSYEDVYHLYGYTDSNGNKYVSAASAIRYILGDYSKLNGETINVLEIEPAGEYQYSDLTDDEAKQILKYLQISIQNLTDGVASYVNVTSVAMNEFIAMTEDIESNYDLIIIGETLDETYSGKYLSGYAYSGYGKDVTYTNYNTATNGTYRNDKVNLETIETTYSGNDLTVNAYDKLEAYIASGKPMVLADSIYDGNTTVIDVNSNVYKLHSLVESGNITDESMTGGRVTYIARPTVSVDGYDVEYNEVTVNTEDTSGNDKQITTQIAQVNLERTSLSGFDFKVTAGSETGNYTLEIYVDKNGDGIFGSSADEDNELVYSGDYSDYSGTLSLPIGLRGYLKWQVILTDTDTGMSAEDEGAFVVGYGSDEMRTVKVLQISPGGNTTLILDENQAFLDLFAASSEITGVEVTADDITVVTAEEYEEWYEDEPYISDTGSGDKLSKDGEIGYDIVVLGFGDAFNNNDISDDNGALSNLVDYIEAGNSVLMSHDVTSFTSYSDATYTNVNVTLKSNDVSTIIGWSYNLTSRLRELVGMTTEYTNSLGLTDSTRYRSATASQINNGQINMYPYEIDETIDVARTHSQYLQLDLESDDIVVWYALSGDMSDNSLAYYSLSGSDALNNYYIYSKGNITYTGAGHSTLDGSDLELELFVNTIIKAIASANSIPEIEFDDAIEVDTSEYEMTIRDGEMPDSITFTVTDKDFLGEVGSFKESYVFFDVDGDNKYTAETDILLCAYDGETNDYLQNLTATTLNLESILTQWEVSGDTTLIDNASTIREAFENNCLKITVQVKDNNNGIGRGTLTIINKQLFNLN